MQTEYIAAIIIVGGLLLIYSATVYSRYLRKKHLSNKHVQDRARISMLQQRQLRAQVRQDHPRTLTSSRTHTAGNGTITTVGDLELGLPAYEPRRDENATTTRADTLTAPPPAYHL